MDFGSTGAMRSPFSPRVRQSITGRRALGISSAKKNQSKFLQTPGDQTGDVVYKTPMTTIETYGMPLPVMVTEALTFASGEISVRMSPCGWCWVVSGRRIVTWARTPGSSGVSSPAPGSTIARELTLPQTDLAHKADLVVVFYEDEAQMPSCIGVSPEGTVRYWPSVGQEGVYVDVSCELAGQECERLSDYTAEGLVLATTTCTVVILTPTVVDGRSTVTCRQLRPPSGWLGGIGRRVSLLFFGSMPAHADTKLVGVVVLPGGGSGGGGEAEAESTVALVSGGPALQLWRGAELHEHELRRALAADQLSPHGDLNSLEIMALDVRASGNDGLLLLIATVNVARSPEMRYAIAHIAVGEPSRVRVTSLTWARGWAGDADEPPRFLPLAHRALLYTSKYIAIVSTTVSNDKVDYIDVCGAGDRILGAELCGGVPLLFSAKHGVLALLCNDSVVATPSMCESPMGSPCPSDTCEGNLSLYAIDPHEVSMVTRDACGKLKTAFLFHVRRDALACRALVDELFPPSPSHPSPPGGGGERDERDVDSVLDRTVLTIATEMLDDVPTGDPRWKPRGGGATNISLGSSAALELEVQLRDKQRAFTLFVDFLRAAGLWQRLGLLSKESGGGVISTESALGGLAEQLAIAIALRKLQHGSDGQLIDAAINEVVNGSDGEVEEEEWVEAALSSGALAPGDVVYRRASRAARVLRALARAPAAPPAGVLATMRVLTNVLTAVHKARAQWQASGRAAPVTPCVGPRALLPALVDLHKRALTNCAQNYPEPNLRAQVFEAAGALADLVLADAEHLNRAPHTAPAYERMRRDLIQPFLDEGQLERAAALADKFKDFELLIEMCVKNDDYDRLFTYIDKYSNEGMAEVTFAWLWSRGGRARGALTSRVGARYGARLRAWLGRAPARTELLALHQLQRAEHAGAAAALATLADDERDSLARMTTMASLSKLCLLASDETDVQSSDAWLKVESRLSLAELHSALPRDIKIHHGMDEEDTKVLPPEELVQMYIESESKSLTEYDYKKALDLTDFIQDMERRDDLRLRVWCACIRRDEWGACRVGAPQDELNSKMFFRLIDLVHIMGGDLELLLPPVEDILTAPELAELVSDSRFHFIIKYGYECVDTTRNVMVED